MLVPRQLNEVFRSLKLMPVVVITRLEWVKQVIAAHVGLCASTHMDVTLIDPSARFRPETLALVASGLREYGLDVDTGRLNVITYMPSEPPRGLTVLVVPEDSPPLTAKGWKRVITLATSASELPRGLRPRLKVRVSRVSGNLFTFASGSRRYLLKVSTRGVRIPVVHVSPIEGKVLEALRSVFMEYGPLEKGDVMPVLEHYTGLSRGQLNRIIVGLVRKGVLSVEGGVISLTGVQWRCDKRY